MRAVKNNGAGPVTVVDVDEPDGDGEIIEVRSVSICASDFLYRQWGSEQIAGHEIAGVRSDGTPVAVEAIFGCGACDLGLQGNHNLCAMCSVEVLGMSVPGGMSQYFLAPSRALIPLPDGLPAENAASWPGQEFFVKEVRAAPSLGYCGGPHGRREFSHVADLLASRPELVDRLITHRFGIDDAPAAFDAASNRSSGTFRVVVHPNG